MIRGRFGYTSYCSLLAAIQGEIGYENKKLEANGPIKPANGPVKPVGVCRRAYKKKNSIQNR